MQKFQVPKAGNQWGHILNQRKN